MKLQIYNLSATWQNFLLTGWVRSFKKQVQNYEIKLKKTFFGELKLSFFLGRALILY